MRDYGRIPTAFWTSPETKDLTDAAKILVAYLLTGPHTTLIGCFRIPAAYVSADLGCPIERVSEGFAELFRNGFATRDESSEWVLIHSFLSWNPIENPNQGKSAGKLFRQVPQHSGLRGRLYQEICRYAPKYRGAFEAEFETLAEGLANGSETLLKHGTGTEAGTGEESKPGSEVRDRKVTARKAEAGSFGTVVSLPTGRAPR